LRHVYLPANQMHAIRLGDQIISINGKSFFQSRAELLEALAAKGLTLKDGEVVKKEAIHV